MVEIIYGLMGIACLLIGDILMACYADSFKKNIKYKKLRLIISIFIILPLSVVFIICAIVAFSIFLGLVPCYIF